MTTARVDIDREYARWTVIEIICKHIEKKTKHIRNGMYEAMNIFERYLLKSANTFSAHRNDPILISVDATHSLYTKFTNEIKKKELVKGKPRDLIIFVQKTVESYIYECSEIQAIPGNTDDRPHVHVHVDDLPHEARMYRYEKFARALPADRVRVLTYQATKHGLTTDADINTAITCMMMRYACVLSRGQQWNLPLAWYRFVHEEYGADFEGFASPVNCQLAMIDPDAQYCSLFHDTDQYFGSLGNVFALDPTLLAGRTVIMNPPYIEEIMDEASDTIQSWLTSVRVRVIFNVLDWTDAKYYRDSMDSKFLVYESQLQRDEHAYESTNYHDVLQTGDCRQKLIRAKFPAHVFIFDSRNTDAANGNTVPYSRIHDVYANIIT